MSMCWQLFDTLGILTGSVVNYIVYSYTQSKPNWRIMISLSGIPALLFLTLILFCVGKLSTSTLQRSLLTHHEESPRWLVKKNRYKQALGALITLHQLPSPIIACGELYMIFRRLEAEEREYLGKLYEKSPTRDADPEVQNRNHASVSPPERHENAQQYPLEQFQGNYAARGGNSPSTTYLPTRNGNTMHSPYTADVEIRENIEAEEQDGSTDQTSEDPPLRLETISLSKRIKLLGRVEHIRQ